jgi:ribosomal protein S18 acetylase RimI-like enzyme
MRTANNGLPLPLLRPLAPADLPAARALLEAEGARHGYALRTIEVLESAATGAAEGEYRAVVSREDDGALVGLLLYGLVAGSVGAGMLHGIVVAPASRRRGVGRALVEDGVRALAASGARVVFAELAEDAALADVRALIASARFVREARVPDLLRDGVALTIWRRDDRLEGRG